MGSIFRLFVCVWLLVLLLLRRRLLILLTRLMLLILLLMLLLWLSRDGSGNRSVGAKLKSSRCGVFYFEARSSNVSAHETKMWHSS